MTCNLSLLFRCCGRRVACVVWSWPNQDLLVGCRIVECILEAPAKYSRQSRKSFLTSAVRKTEACPVRVAVMIWILWQNRNNWVWNNTKLSAIQLGTQSYHIWTKLHQVFVHQVFVHQNRYNNTSITQVETS
jgi:hypothetical protein